MPRCSSCNKMASLDAEVEPEVELSVAPDDDGASVTGTVRIVNSCADCGTEVTESVLDVDVFVPLKHAQDCKDNKELELSHEVTRIEEFLPPKARRQRHMYGAEADIDLKCESCGAMGEAHWKDTVQSSHMEQV